MCKINLTHAEFLAVHMQTLCNITVVIKSEQNYLPVKNQKESLKFQNMKIQAIVCIKEKPFSHPLNLSIYVTEVSLCFRNKPGGIPRRILLQSPITSAAQPSSSAIQQPPEIPTSVMTFFHPIVFVAPTTTHPALFFRFKSLLNSKTSSQKLR